MAGRLRLVSEASELYHQAATDCLSAELGVVAAEIALMLERHGLAELEVKASSGSDWLASE